MFAQDDQVAVFAAGDLGEEFGDLEGFGGGGGGRGEYVDAAVGAHGHGGAQDVGAFGGAGGEGEDVGDGEGAAFAEADGFFQGEFVEGVDAVFDVGGFDGGVGFVDAGFDLGGEGRGGLVRGWEGFDWGVGEGLGG